MTMRANTFSQACKGEGLRAPGWFLPGSRLITKHN